MTQEISLILADDHLLFVEGIRSLLSSQADMSIVAEVHTGRALLELLNTVSADVLLLDINMPSLNGLEVVHFIRQKDKKLRIIMLSSYKEDNLIKMAVKAGADGYLVKDVDSEELIRSIRTVYAGETSFPPKGQPLYGHSTGEDPFLKQFNLTKREREILSFIKKGFTNQQISQELFLSIYTVETHRKNIMLKLGLKSPAALIRFLMEHRI